MNYIYDTFVYELYIIQPRPTRPTAGLPHEFLGMSTYRGLFTFQRT